MRQRRLVFGLIGLVLLALSIVTAAKLRATPKYDRIWKGMTLDEVESILGKNHDYDRESSVGLQYGPRVWEIDEGTIVVDFYWKVDSDEGEVYRGGVSRKELVSRSPFDRLAWLIWGPHAGG
jgi:hypothetical protein